MSNPVLDRFPYTVHRSFLGTQWAIACTHRAFPVRETRAWLVEHGWTSQAISSEATVHHRSQADQKRFLELPIPVHVNRFSAWIDTMSGSPQRRRPGTLLVTDSELMGLAETSGHAEATPRLRLLRWLAEGHPLHYRHHPKHPGEARRLSSLIHSRMITATGPPSTENINVGLWHIDGELDLDAVLKAVRRQLSGYWGTRFVGDRVFFCSAGELGAVEAAGEPLARTGAAVATLRPTGISVLPRTACASGLARMHHFMQWLTTTWPCRAQDLEYGTEWPLGVQVVHLWPDIVAQARWRHGHAGVLESAPPAGSAAVLAVLKAARGAQLWACVDGVIARMDGLLPWLLQGCALHADGVRVGPRLKAVAQAEAAVALLILRSDCPLYSPSHLQLADLGLGEIPAEVGELDTLVDLDLEGNGLRALPRWLPRLSQLRHLTLNDNTLTAST